MRHWRQQLTVFVLCSVATIMSARAADNPPLGAWNVGPIHAKASNGVGHCSMKTSYADGSTLVFARDASDSNSIAIDFGKKLLTAGAQYSVTLDVGMVTRQFIGVAATDNVMMIQVGDDPGFYDTLRKKDVMQVSFADLSLSYGLEGSGDALNALTDCASDMKDGKGAGQVEINVKTPAPRVPAKATDADKTEMSISNQAYKSSMKSEIDRLQEENRKLMMENQSITRQLDEKAEEDPDLVIAKAQQKKLKAENQKLQQQLKAKKQAAKEVDDGQDDVIVAKPVEKPEPKPIKTKDPEEEGLLVRILKAGQIPAQLSGLSGTSAVYTWEDGDIDGGAIEDPLHDGQTISDAVAEYSGRAERGCQGDFAQKMSEVKHLDKGHDIVTGEMACMDGNKDTASATLFVTDGHVVAAIMFDGPTAQVADVLAKREALADKINSVVKEARQ